MRLTIVGSGDAFGSGGRFNTCFWLDTAKATLEWWRAQAEARRAQPEGWPSREQELQAIAKLK